MRLKALVVTVVLGLGIVLSGCGSSKQGASGSSKGQQSASSSKSGGKSAASKSGSKSGGKSAKSGSKSSSKSTSKSKSGSKSEQKSSTKKAPPPSPKTTGTTTASGNPTGSNAAAAALFQKKCQVCHGPGGVGASAPKLDAGMRSRFSTQSSLQSFIKKNMPFNDPGTLSDAQASALARYIWSVQKP